MSYCRWSSMNGYCDAYVYEDVHGGWTVHVAGRRQPTGAPPDPFDIYTKHEWCPAVWKWNMYQNRQKLKIDWRERNQHEDIDSEYAGMSANFETPGECADFLELLISDGLNVPVGIVETLREEQEEFDEATV